jgi:hypothetical protein
MNDSHSHDRAYNAVDKIRETMHTAGQTPQTNLRHGKDINVQRKNWMMGLTSIVASNRDRVVHVNAMNVVSGAKIPSQTNEATPTYSIMASVT